MTRPATPAVTAVGSIGSLGPQIAVTALIEALKTGRPGRGRGLEVFEAVHLILRMPQRAIPKTCDSTMQRRHSRMHPSRQGSLVVRVACGMG
jgi:hypothetical protein